MGLAQTGGLYYRGGVAVDANGNAVKGAPPQPSEHIPAAPAAPKTLAQEIADAIAPMMGAATTGVALAQVDGINMADEVAAGVARGIESALPLIVAAVKDAALDAATAPSAPASTPAEKK